MKVQAILRQGVLIRLFENEETAQAFADSHNRIFKHGAPCVVVPWNVLPDRPVSVEIAV